jgi:hypothetical protein
MFYMATDPDTAFESVSDLTSGQNAKDLQTLLNQLSMANASGQPSGAVQSIGTRKGVIVKSGV